MNNYIFLLFYIILLPFYAYFYLASLQLNGYNAKRIIDSHNLKLVRFYIANVVLSAIFLSVNIALYFYVDSLYIQILDCVYVVLFLVLLILNRKIFYKTPLVFTARIKRLYFSIFVCFTVSLILFNQYLSNILAVVLPIVSAVIPICVLVVHFIILPFEHINNLRYIHIAHKRYQTSKAVKICITGSYAKTSVKTILNTMLSGNFNVEMTGKNYNTPLGLSISSKSLNDDTEIFIAEFGARHVGDIKKLCKICKPDIAVVTGICKQHIETFKSIDNIIKTKAEIYENLGENGMVFFNGKNLYCQDMYKNCKHNKAITYLDNQQKVFADNVVLSSSGTEFVLHINNQQIECKTRLLGKRVIENIVLCSSIASYLGVSIENISKKIETLDYIPHRLEVTKSNGITIIDDSYNANELGIEEALDVLSLFKGRKVVLVSGMVELGDIEQSLNLKLGIAISKVCDLVLLIDTKQSVDVCQGLILGGTKRENIIMYKSLDEAVADFNKVLLTNDNLLLLADLPSNYSR